MKRGCVGIDIGMLAFDSALLFSNTLTLYLREFHCCIHLSIHRMLKPSEHNLHGYQFDLLHL
jgi:hypothetical protein